jgi:hypothetical protein
MYSIRQSKKASDIHSSTRRLFVPADSCIEVPHRDVGIRPPSLEIFRLPTHECGGRYLYHQLRLTQPNPARCNRGALVPSQATRITTTTRKLSSITNPRTRIRQCRPSHMKKEYSSAFSFLGYTTYLSQPPRNGSLRLAAVVACILLLTRMHVNLPWIVNQASEQRIRRTEAMQSSGRRCMSCMVDC